jgi:hypothetical protein
MVQQVAAHPTIFINLLYQLFFALLLFRASSIQFSSIPRLLKSFWGKTIVFRTGFIFINVDFQLRY